MEEGELYQANSGAIRFQVKSLSGVAHLALCSINPPHKELFKIFLGRTSSIQPLHNGNEEVELIATGFIDLAMQHQEFWITWFGSQIFVGSGDQTNPFIWLSYDKNKDEMIGYVKFYKRHVGPQAVSVPKADWIYEESPILSTPTTVKNIKSGKLRWVSMNTEVNSQLPADALIGGFEKEPLYISRAQHNGSLCPGKYVASQKEAYVAWGGREHIKKQFEILCGYNAAWVQTTGARIPQNAFIAGISEVRQEPLFIGRGIHDGCLINGKIHVNYKTCYLPYYGKEIEIYSFEILVVPELDYRGVLSDVPCNVDSLSAEQAQNFHRRFFF